MAKTVISLQASEVGRLPAFPRSNTWSKRSHGRRGHGLGEEQCIRSAQAIGTPATCQESKEPRCFVLEEFPFPRFSEEEKASLHSLFRGACARPRGMFRLGAERRQSSDRDPRGARSRPFDCTSRRHRRKRVRIVRSSIIFGLNVNRVGRSDPPSLLKLPVEPLL